jgi:hypothetical protein
MRGCRNCVMIAGDAGKHDQTLDAVLIHLPYPAVPQVRGIFWGSDPQPLGDSCQWGLSREVLACQASERLEKLV